MKYVYSFNEGNKDMRNTLGGKGANLCEMTNLGLPVPYGFIVSTDACIDYYNNNGSISDEILDEIYEKLEELEKTTGKIFGDSKNPLLLSVRSGARSSMPGMMDTVLNLGMNDEVCDFFSNKRFSYDSYRRFIQMYADVVMGFPKESFEGLFDKIKQEKKVKYDTDLTEEDLKEVITRYKEEYQRLSKTSFPTDPKEQLISAIKAVFKSWNNERAITYRRLNDIPSSWGTAVNVQEMVFGNKNNNSATGVAFTRNPATGEKVLYGEYLVNAQGEDVVAGIRTPKSIINLKQEFPDCYNEFTKIADTLEKHYHDMQDMEFTIEDNKLYILQTRNGKRTGTAAVKIAMDLLKENMIDEKEAILMVDAKTLDQLLHKTFNKELLKNAEKIAEGLPASPGSAYGKICFDAKHVKYLANNNEKNLILVRDETSPEDIEGINIANGILTLRGGTTSHAAVVARGMGTCCVCGCSSLKIDYENKTLETDSGIILHEDDYISLDGTTGYVYLGKIEVEDPVIKDDFKELLDLTDKYKSMEVRANAETLKDSKTALSFGALGIGLCRTEHMFFENERIFNFRKMILSKTKEEREDALNKILPYQIEDFYNLFKVMNELSVNIRLLDPPLHEFLPKKEEEKIELAKALNISYEDLNNRINSLKEFNPMMGHRGIRLGVTYPEIVVMQTKAIIEAAIKAEKENFVVEPEIMIPLVCNKKELQYVKDIIKETADKIIKENKANVSYKIGTMIEIPRAAIISKDIASDVEFYSFGTNDLTQMTYGFSRDDAEKFLPSYYQKQIFEFDPFVRVDEEGVGTLIKNAIKDAKEVNKDIKIGVCGEHAGDPKSIEFFAKVGVDYVSCSPYRVPIARLAVAQATIKTETFG
ncbi:MAG: pyruvate, phosphate dikinase [bacterium]|nr:pyruvate, phosphate dikinase [bacterium]